MSFLICLQCNGIKLLQTLVSAKVWIYSWAQGFLSVVWKVCIQNSGSYEVAGLLKQGLLKSLPSVQVTCSAPWHSIQILASGPLPAYLSACSLIWPCSVPTLFCPASVSLHERNAATGAPLSGFSEPLLGCRTEAPCPVPRGRGHIHLSGNLPGARDAGDWLRASPVRQQAAALLHPLQHWPPFLSSCSPCQPWQPLSNDTFSVWFKMIKVTRLPGLPFLHFNCNIFTKKQYIYFSLNWNNHSHTRESRKHFVRTYKMSVNIKG